jgi:hypothetical protein
VKDFTIIPATKQQCDALVRARHYSRRPSIFWKGFALVAGGKIEGVAVYGQPSAAIQRHAFRDRNFRFYELSRVVVQTPERNAASFLIGRSLAMLEQPCAVVSYADTAWGHSGCIYQATNWLYTGATKSHDHLYMIDGVATHPMTLRDRGITNPKEWAREQGIITVPPKEKHRYFYLCGGKRERRDMAQRLRYSVAPYPKADASRYDDGERIEIGVAQELF